MFSRRDWVEEVLHLRWRSTGCRVVQDVQYGDMTVACADALMFAYAEGREVALVNQFGEIISHTRLGPGT